MKSKSTIMTSTKVFLIAFAMVAALAVDPALTAATESKKETAAVASTQKRFNTPKEAADSLVQAAASFDVPTLKEILGPDATDIVSSEDPVADRNKG